MSHDLNPLNPPHRCRGSSENRWTLLWPAKLLGDGLDWLDERMARRKRRKFGRKGWLLSWSTDPEGRWLARLSGPRFPRTVERTAKSRLQAIGRSARALTRLEALWGQLGRPPSAQEAPGKGERLDPGPSPSKPR